MLLSKGVEAQRDPTEILYQWAVDAPERDWSQPLLEGSEKKHTLSVEETRLRLLRWIAVALAVVAVGVNVIAFTFVVRG